jgi:hypothetical protein
VGQNMREIELIKRILTFGALLIALFLWFPTNQAHAVTAQDLLNLRDQYNDSEQSQEVLQQLIEAAQSRKTELLGLMRTDPEAFLEDAVLASEHETFPEEVYLFLEKEMSFEGNFYMRNIPTPTETDDMAKFVLKNATEPQVNLFLTESNRLIEQAQTVQVNGISIDKDMVAEDTALIVTSSHDLSGEPEFVSRIDKALVILVNFPNQTVPVASNAVNAAAQAASFFHLQNSYDTIDIQTLTLDWVTISNGGNNLCDDLEFMEEANAIITNPPYNINLADYRHRVYGFGLNSGCRGEYGSVEGYYYAYSSPSLIVINDFGLQSTFTQAHELAHALHSPLTIGHANFLDCGNKTIDREGNCTSKKYMDEYDVLGGGINPILRAFNAPHKIGSGWISPLTLTSATGPTTHIVNGIITGVDDPAGGTSRAYKIWKQDTQEYYVISYRQRVGVDGNLPSSMGDGVSIHVWDDRLIENITNFLDMTPGDGDLSNATLIDGAEFYDPINDIKIKQLSHTFDSATISVEIGNPTDTFYSCDPDEWSCFESATGGFQNQLGCIIGCEILHTCDPWRVACENGSHTESDCATQSLFNATWPNWPGGGYGRWVFEACGELQNMQASYCPNAQQDPIGGCVTIDCPNGDTNGDGRCTESDIGGHTQGTWQPGECPQPDSSCGDVNIYREPYDPVTNVDFSLYCGTTYKNLDCDLPQYRFNGVIGDTEGNIWTPIACSGSNQGNVQLNCTSEGCQIDSWQCSGTPHFDATTVNAMTNVNLTSLPANYQCLSWEVYDTTTNQLVNGASGCESAYVQPSGDWQRRIEFTIKERETWNMQANVYCPFGYQPNYLTQLRYSINPSSPVQWTSDTFSSGLHAMQVSTYDNSGLGYLSMIDQQGRVLRPYEAWHDEKWQFDQAFNPAIWVARWDVADLPDYNQYVTYYAPDDVCECIPTPQVPANGAVVQGSVSYSWEHCGATRYRLRVTGPNVNYTSGPINGTTNSPSLNYTVGGQYTWKVQPCFNILCSQGFVGPWSPQFTFDWTIRPTPTSVPTPTPTPNGTCTCDLWNVTENRCYNDQTAVCTGNFTCECQASERG